ncbi:MAG: NblA/ycf18 family protein [Chroococcidiopsidaceae cyanobacterium CP_BM_ER_R8_30]|nr:NblA/ycf18 family protein [Chroococcidiopsidaceae cyanobacterium CP_BM_ER_R8_30]
MSGPIMLSPEQEFSIKSFELQVKEMSLEQAKDFLVKLYQHMVISEVTYRELLQHEWGL